MRRVIAVAVFVAAVAALIGGLLPGAVGLYLEHRHSALLDAVAARGYRLTARDYRLGWRRSEAEVEIGPPAKGDDASSRLRIALALRHGYDVWLHGLPPRLAAISGRASLLGGPRPLPPLLLAATLGLAGDVEGTVRVPDVTYSGAVGRLHFLSGLSEFELTPQGHWTLSGQLAALEAQDPGGRKLRLEGLGWSLSQSDAATTLPVGVLSLKLERLSLDPSATQPALALGGLEVALGAEREDAMVAVHASGHVATLTVGGHAYAPSRFALSLGGMPAAALQALREQFEALDTAALTASQRGAGLAQAVVGALPRLLAAEPRLVLSTLALSTPYGKVAARAELRVAPPPEAAADVQGGTRLAGDPLRILVARLHGAAELSGPQALVVALIAEQQGRRARRELGLRGVSAAPLPPALAAELEAAAQASAQQLLREGWLVAEQGRVMARLRLDNGNLTINGKPVAVADWLMMDTPRRAVPALR